ncbi:cytochrome P450 [Apodospora peruviana]|uniref:Cytochrome P450 n=1 Tax=Apodospora peruviana TaxID=516989 RepID=A0AAE0IDB5_9PEZI|nr:cytochrome P450 [Apodospora peruviana]
MARHLREQAAPPEGPLQPNPAAQRRPRTCLAGRAPPPVPLVDDPQETQSRLAERHRNWQNAIEIGRTPSKLAERHRNWQNAIDKIERRLTGKRDAVQDMSSSGSGASSIMNDDKKMNDQKNRTRPLPPKKKQQRFGFLTRVLISGRVSDDDGGKNESNAGRSGITRDELTTNCLAFVIADFQLTMVVLTTAVYFLLREPSRWDRLAWEVRARFARREEITVQSTNAAAGAGALPYLETIITETLRVRHHTPINLSRVVVDKRGRVIDGVGHVPCGAVVGVNLQNMQTNEASWVEGSEFREERWLKDKISERFARDVKEAYMSFPKGPRNCIGSKVFLARARLFPVRLAWEFELGLEE